MHPGPAEWFGHDMLYVSNAVALCNDGLFFRIANVLAIASVEGHIIGPGMKQRMVVPRTL
jgi:hypothetical protein